jgi:hypothetical protein
MSDLIGLDFCGTVFERQSLRDLSYHWATGRSFHLAPRWLRNRLGSKLIQLFFILFSSEKIRKTAVENYAITFSSKVDKKILEKYFNRKDEKIVFIASGSAYELVQQVMQRNGIECPIIAAPLLSGFSERWNNFVIRPWTGHEKVRRIILQYPSLSQGSKISIFETDSAVDRPVSVLCVQYIEISQDDRFGFNY